jgi:hypothetical protein
MKIDIPMLELPSIEKQQAVIFENSTLEAIEQLHENLNARVIPGQTEINENDYSREHLLEKDVGWVAPHQDVVGAYFRHFQENFIDYSTDKKLAYLFGLSSDRRIREFKQGTRKVPYNVWRKFLIITGRAPQNILKVMAFVVDANIENKI